ncbi:MAG: hypothetical protein VKM68_05490 [Cyanobacteriota bacterium]|jgi:hypothetical protein|nr:hypothetical protein [Cyanobacteriota bacterium]
MKTPVLKTLSAKQAESVSGGLFNGFSVNTTGSNAQQSVGYVGIGLVGIGRIL